MRSVLLSLILACAAIAQSLPWDIKTLNAAPKMEQFETTEPGVRALMYESVSWHGKPTRVFAYYGAPARPNGQRLPAMVLIHGGGGTAFAEWVRMWNARGYAAIAIDTCGARPEPAGAKPWDPMKQHHADGGPPGWGGFAQIDDPESDQWTYHAVAAVVLAHSLIRTFPEVDPKRIGVTGISWGGYLTSIVAGVDARFQFAAPVYGCGFLGEDSAWLKEFAKMGSEKSAKWLRFWDPSTYLPRAKMPLLWVNGTNDFAYPMPSWQKSYRLPRGPRTLALRVAMPHGHPAGARPDEIAAFADAILRHGQALPKVTQSKTLGAEVHVAYRSTQTVVRAELNFTKADGKWQERKWETVPAQLDAKAQRVDAQIPPEARVWYVNLFDAQGRVVSTEHESR